MQRLVPEAARTTTGGAQQLVVVDGAAIVRVDGL